MPRLGKLFGDSLIKDLGNLVKNLDLMLRVKKVTAEMLVAKYTIRLSFEKAVKSDESTELVNIYIYI